MYNIQCLSWCSKLGINREARQILAYHVVPGSTSLLHYSRDEQAEPLRLLQQTLSCIRSETFFPDLTRSGYIKKSDAEREGIMRPTDKFMPSRILDPAIEHIGHEPLMNLCIIKNMRE